MDIASRTSRRRNLRTFISVLGDVFQSIDADGNGSLSRHEVAAFVRTAKDETVEQRVAIFLARNFDFLSSISYIRAHTAMGEISDDDIKFLSALFSPRELEKLICLTPCLEHTLCAHFESADQAAHLDVADMFEKRSAAELMLAAF